MHWTLLITFDQDRAATSEEARRYAFTQLADARSFVDWDGGGVIADWIEIGGRASGMLTRAKEPVPTQMPHPYSSGRLVDVLPASPEVLLDYTSLGKDDDAMVVDTQLYKTVLRPFERLNRAYGGDLPIFPDLTGDPVSRDAYVGLKWLVVVDCHS